MMQKRENFIVLCTTVLFGILSRALVGIPYMVWSHFDKTFLLSFLLWALYTGIMYCAVKAAAVSSGRRITLFTASLLFGLTAKKPRPVPGQLSKYAYIWKRCYFVFIFSHHKTLRFVSVRYFLYQETDSKICRGPDPARRNVYRCVPLYHPPAPA